MSGQKRVLPHVFLVPCGSSRAVLIGCDKCLYLKTSHAAAFYLVFRWHSRKVAESPISRTDQAPKWPLRRDTPRSPGRCKRETTASSSKCEERKIVGRPELFQGCVCRETHKVMVIWAEVLSDDANLLAQGMEELTLTAGDFIVYMCNSCCCFNLAYVTLLFNRHANEAHLELEHRETAKTFHCHFFIPHQR